MGPARQRILCEDDVYPGSAEIWLWLLPRVELLQAYGRIQASPLPPGHVAKRHQRLVEALRQGNPEEVRRKVEEHIRMGQTMAILHAAPEERP